MKQPRLPHALPAAALLILSSAATAAIPLHRASDQQLDFYGFAKLDATYQSDGTNSMVAPRFATGGDESATNLSAMHSRFGFTWRGPSLVNGYRAGAVLEFDLFDPASSNQSQLRDRLAALTLSREGTTWLFGQHWDVFSPLNPTTLMTNGNLWGTGNLGFRRAQIRYSGRRQKHAIANWAASVNDPSAGGTPAANTESPIFEGRIGFRAGEAQLGLSFALGDDESSGDKETISGLSFDWIVPFGNDFTIKGEAATGENLGAFMSRSGTEQNVLAVWAQLQQLVSGDNDWWAGLGFENVGDVAAGIEDTRMLFGGYQWNLAGTGGGTPVHLGVEGARMDSDLAGGGDESATQVMFAIRYDF